MRGDVSRGNSRSRTLSRGRASFDAAGRPIFEDTWDVVEGPSSSSASLLMASTLSEANARLASIAADARDSAQLVTQLQQALSSQTVARFDAEKERDDALSLALTVSEDLGGELTALRAALAARNERIRELEAEAARRDDGALRSRPPDR